VACVGEKRVLHIEFQWGNLREGDHLEDLIVYARIVVKWILEN
jgi:hypothetical protein